MVKRLTVTQVHAGSNPVGHPSQGLLLYDTLALIVAIAQWLRVPGCVPGDVGSTPTSHL